MRRTCDVGALRRQQRRGQRGQAQPDEYHPQELNEFRSPLFRIVWRYVNCPTDILETSVSFGHRGSVSDGGMSAAKRKCSRDQQVLATAVSHRADVCQLHK